MESEQEIYIRCFKHFALRLSERYGIFITFDEYVELCKFDYIKFQKRVETYDKVERLRNEGWLIIHNTPVKVIRNVGVYKPLITALPLLKDDKYIANKLKLTVCNKRTLANVDKTNL